MKRLRQARLKWSATVLYAFNTRLLYSGCLANEQVGRLLPDTNRKFRFAIYAGRGKSEHYRAASPLTAGRFMASAVKRRQVQQRVDQPRLGGVMGEMVRPLRA